MFSDCRLKRQKMHTHTQRMQSNMHMLITKQKTSGERREKKMGIKCRRHKTIKHTLNSTRKLIDETFHWKHFIA